MNNSIESGDSTSQPSGDSNTAEEQGNLVFVTMPRPIWDFHREYDEDELEEMSEEEVEKLQMKLDSEFETYFEKKPRDTPNWRWILSTSAYKLSQQLDREFQKRDQDRFGMYIYNDFTGYGIQEVLENWLQSFVIEFRRVKSSTLQLWVYMEALAWVCCQSDIDFVAWNMIDDGDRVRHTLEQIGLALLSTLNRLEKDGLWDAIPNISLILSIFFTWAPDFKDAMYDQTWLNEVVAYTEKHAMEIEGTFDIQKTLDNYSTDDLDDGCIRRVHRPPSKDKHKFIQQVCLPYLRASVRRLGCTDCHHSGSNLRSGMATQGTRSR